MNTSYGDHPSLSPQLTDVDEIRDFCMWVDNYDVPEAFEHATVEQCQETLDAWFDEEDTDGYGQDVYRKVLCTYWAVVQKRVDHQKPPFEEDVA